MEPSAIPRAEQDFGDQSVFERVRGAPFAGDQGIVAEVPPGIVGEVLLPAVDLPLAAYVERLVIHQEYSTRTLALAVSQGRDIDAFRPAVDRVRPGIASLVSDLVRLDHLDDLGGPRVGLGVEDVDARRPQARHNKIAPLDMRVRRI